LSQPLLIVFAGCNGSGKSTFSSSYVDKGLIPYDFDKKFMEIYYSLVDSELRQEMAQNMSIGDFKNSIKNAFSSKQDFCYETNFDAHPIFWAEEAKKLGYRIELHFYCLSSIELAKKRVGMRVRNQGHFVNNDVIFHKWKEGYKNLNLHYKFFDFVLFIDNSSHIGPPQNIFAFIKDDNNNFQIQKYRETIPNYTMRRCPDIYNLYLELTS
jgi:predicted ABC-type ATPase